MQPVDRHAPMGPSTVIGPTAALDAAVIREMLVVLSKHAYWDLLQKIMKITEDYVIDMSCVSMLCTDWTTSYFTCGSMSDNRNATGSRCRKSRSRSRNSPRSASLQERTSHCSTCPFPRWLISPRTSYSIIVFIF